MTCLFLELIEEKTLIIHKVHDKNGLPSQSTEIILKLLKLKKAGN